MPDALFDISVIIPAKNEEKRIPRFLDSLISYCQKSRLRYQLIVVDDGSSDKTAEIIINYKKSFPQLNLMSLGKNHGKGFAIKQGILSAKGRIVLFMDADGATPADEIEKNLKYFEEGYDIVIGSSVMHQKDCSVKALLYRKTMGFIFNFLVRTLLIKGIKDTQCGFKMFRGEIVRPLWEKVRIEGFGVDLEVLFLAQKMNYKIKEVAVNWTHVDESKINLVRDSLRMFHNIFQIRSWYG
ncbi:MAG: glycosyltransferase family 2 protein [Candidatus Omnitrophica bacterium]|nr:glycosyltransferase family 2 protein [Candidatus Omnitrophota bacterium]